MHRFAAFCVLLFGAMIARAQAPVAQSKWVNGFWQAKWIAHPGSGPAEFGVYHFRKKISLERKPASFIIHVSADNLYRLFVNGQSVATGPARSDPANWNFETLDIAPYLNAGENLLSATVWNFAEDRAYAQTSYETAFIVQGDGPLEKLINTGKDWKVTRNKAYRPLPIDRAAMQSYLAVASGEEVDAAAYSWGFEDITTPDQDWEPAKVLWYPAKSRSYGTDGNWHLVPRSIPMMEERPQVFHSERTGALDSMTGGKSLQASFPLQIPARAKLRLLLDQGMLTNAYPWVQVSGGSGATLQWTYAEALIDQRRQKGHRNDVAGKHILGIRDRYKPNGGTSRRWQSLHYRTFRYVELLIETKDQPLTIDSLGSIYTGYPFEEKARFQSSDSSLRPIWETGWRTAKLCAMDTYMDCPYYEQLQYVGDTRIQALISLYVSGDDRLMRKSIDDIAHSFIPEGLTQSRYPSRDLQVIPTFSLWWVCMLHDYYRHRTDDAFIQGHLNGVAQVLNWYDEKLDSVSGLLGPLSWWQFVDWSWPWVDSIRVGGVPPGASKGGSSIITLQYAYTLQWAAELMKAYGKPEQAARYAARARELTGRTYALCFDQVRGLMADVPDKSSFSQHAAILAILTDAIPAAAQAKVLEKILEDPSITQATYYFRFYLFEAMKKTGMGNRFLNSLEPWQDMLDIGLTTFAENPEPTRSDCHAWSASPVYAMLSITAGIEPAAPGFRKVRIRPNPGQLGYINAAVPLPSGQIALDWKKMSVGSRAIVEMPAGISGVLEWKGKSFQLRSGRNVYDLE